MTALRRASFAFLGFLLFPVAIHAQDASIWLRANKGAKEFDTRLLEAIDSAIDVFARIALLEEFVPFIKAPESQKALQSRLVGLLAALGRFREASYASEALARFYGTPPDRAALAASIRLALTSSDPERASRLLAELRTLPASATDREEEALFSAWADWSQGETGKAREKALALAAATLPAIRVSALFLLWGLSSGEEAKGMSERLAKDFPHSLEAALAGGRAGIGFFPSPAWYFSSFIHLGPLVREDSASSSTGSQIGVAPGPGARAPQGRSFYQVGAYARVENAEAAVASLRAKGFAAEAIRRGDLIVVIVPWGADPAAMLIGLKDAGYEAYPYEP